MNLAECHRGHTWDRDARHQCGECKVIYQRTRPKRARRCEQAKAHPDRNAAWRAVENAIARGQLQRARTLACTDCSLPAREYDHYKGYELQHRLDVQPVCRSCHVARTWNKKTPAEG